MCGRMRRLGLLLCLGLVARAGDENVIQLYDLADLKEIDEAWWAVAISRARSAAQGGNVALKEKVLVVSAPPAVQEKVGKEIAEVRKAFEHVVVLDVRVARIEGGAGGAAVPLDRIDAFLKEKGATDLSKPTLVCWNGQAASLEVTREISYVSDFDVALDGVGDVTADPVVSTIRDGLSAKLRPIAHGQGVRVVAELSVTDVAAPMPEVELPYPLGNPLKVQAPESTTCSVTRLVECSPDAFTVVAVGGPWVVLLRATLRPAHPEAEVAGK